MSHLPTLGAIVAHLPASTSDLIIIASWGVASAAFVGWMVAADRRLRRRSRRRGAGILRGFAVS